MIIFQGPEISVNSEGPVMIYQKYFDKEDVIMKVLCSELAKSIYFEWIILQIQGAKEDFKLKMNSKQNLEEKARLVAQLSENEKIKMKISLNFSPGHCCITSDFTLCNKTNLDLMIEVTTRLLF